MLFLCCHATYAKREMLIFQDFHVTYRQAGLSKQIVIYETNTGSFQIQNLQVTVSGFVKYTIDPCFTSGCPQPFVITQISK
jgi:hypothetical protein